MMPLDLIRIVLVSILVVGYGVLLWMDAKQKKSDILACEDIIKKNSLTFYKAFSKIPHKRKREAVYAVYAFCRYADDLIDEDHDREGLDKLKEELDLYRQGHTPHHFRWRALRDTTRSFYAKDYDYKPFYEMIEGQKMDVDFKGYETEEDLLTYCYHVAGTVGLMLIPILAHRHQHELNEFAINLGYGMQITNILRDVGEDFKNQRIYLPKELMRQANYSHDDLAHGKINIEFINLFEGLAKKAERYFDEALQQLDLFDDDVKLPLGLSIVLYREIINACREQHYDVFTKKNFVSDQRKDALIQTYISSMKRG